MENMPNAAVANSINVVIFSINPSSSDKIFPVSGEIVVLKNNMPPAASVRNIKGFRIAIDLYKPSLFFSVIDMFFDVLAAFGYLLARFSCY